MNFYNVNERPHILISYPYFLNFMTNKNGSKTTNSYFEKKKKQKHYRLNL